MRTIAYIILAAMLLTPLIVANIQCTEGDEPETVIVPVGEPGDSDPYDNAGFDCDDDDDSSTQAEPAGENEMGEPMVLLTFHGATDTWSLLVTLDEYKKVRSKIEQAWNHHVARIIDHEQVDALQQDLCAPFDRRSEEGRKLYGILKDVLQERLEELASGVCE